MSAAIEIKPDTNAEAIEIKPDTNAAAIEIKSDINELSRYIRFCIIIIRSLRLYH